MFRVLPIVFVGLLACSGEEPATPAAGAAGPPPTQVQVGLVEAGTLDSSVSFLGNVESALATPLAAAAEGTVESVAVREGDAAAQGALLVQLDARRARAELQAAEAVVRRTQAQLDQAKRQLERIATSKAALSAPERERFALDVATLEAQLAADQAAAQRARVELSNHRIAAPFAGVVKDRLINPGAWVSVGQNVLELVSTAEMQVLVDIPYVVGRDISAGSEAQILTGALSANAVVAGVVPALDESTRTMRLRVTLAPGQETPPWLLPGLPVDVQLAIKIEGEGVLVPRDAVLQGPVKSRVIQIKDGVGVPIAVDVLGSTTDKVLVRGQGLKAGDRVITRGNERYRPGTPVTIGE